MGRNWEFLCLLYNNDKAAFSPSQNCYILNNKETVVKISDDGDDTKMNSRSRFCTRICLY